MPLKNLLDQVRGGRPFLVAVAAPAEAEAVLRGTGLSARRVPPWGRVALGGRGEMVVTGVGKANAAGAVAGAAAGLAGGVVSIGLAGSLPGSGLRPGEVVASEWCVLADDGVATPGGFLSQGAMGFPAAEGIGERFATDAAWTRALEPLADRVGGSATVSTCSGTDEGASEIRRRTGALTEDMESAAVALVAHRLGLPFACLRVVSNRTGNRGEQGWDLGLALATLERVAGAL